MPGSAAAASRLRFEEDQDDKSAVFSMKRSLVLQLVYCEVLVGVVKCVAAARDAREGGVLAVDGREPSMGVSENMHTDENSEHCFTSPMDL